MCGLYMFMALQLCNASKPYAIRSRESCCTGYTIKQLFISCLYANFTMGWWHSPFKYRAIYFESILVSVPSERKISRTHTKGSGVIHVLMIAHHI
jgi:hypothetical protein